MKNLRSRLHFDRLLLLLVLAIMVGLLMIQANPLTKLPSRDSGFFLYGGSQILEGKLPYLDFWDSKGPGIFYMNALGLWLGNGYRWGVWLLEYILLMIACYIFFQAVAKKWGTGAALLSNAAWIYGLSRVWEGGNLTEEYSLFFSFILLSYFLISEGEPDRKLYLSVGVIFVINFFFRANNTGVSIAILLALLLASLWHQKYRQSMEILGWAGLSAIAILALLSGYFLQRGVFSEMVEASILYNYFYAGAGQQIQLNLWQGIRQIGWPVIIALSGYIAVVYQSIRKTPIPISTTLNLFLLISFPLEVFLSSLSGRGYLHYWISWMPSVAVLVAFAYTYFAKFILAPQFLEILNHRKKIYFLVTCILVFTYWMTGAAMEYQLTAKRILFARGQGIEMTAPVAEFLRKNTKSEDLVFVWGAYPGINFLARRGAPTPYLFYPAYEESPWLEKMSASFWSDISGNPPEMIVDTSSASPDYILSLDPDIRETQLGYGSLRIYKPPYQNMVFDFVEENYQQVDTINGFDIYLFISR